MKRIPLPIVFFSTALSIVTLGDSLLYVILPSYYTQIGFVPIQVGILLSVNRWVRLATNHLAEHCFRRYPSDLWVIFAFFTGSLVAVTYGLSNLFVVFLAARILWGTSFSFLRQAGVMTVVTSGAGAHLGERMGYFRGINAGLRTIGVFMGGLCHDVFGFTITLVGLGILSLSGVPLGYFSQRKIKRMPKSPTAESSRQGEIGVICCGFAMGLVGPGMIITTLGLVLKTQVGASLGIGGYSMGVATLTGLILGLRRFIDGAGSPVLGFWADRIGRQHSLRPLFPFNAATLIIISLLKTPVLLVGLIFVFFIVSTALMTLLSAQAGQSGSRSVASYVTATDFGMAIGPLIAWSIAQFSLPTGLIFFSGGSIYGIASIIALKTFAKPVGPGSC
jgi:MFS family permease